MAPLNPYGEQSSPFARYIPALTYLLLCVTVVVLFTVNGNTQRQKPWEALSSANVLLAPRRFVYGFYVFFLLLLGVFVVYHQRNPTDPHARGIELFMAAAFVFDWIVWILWVYSHFFVALIFAVLAWLVLMWVFFLMYNNRIDEAGRKPPSFRTYLATSLVISSYAGWLIFEMFLMLSAALTDVDARFFADGAESGPIALVILMSTLVFLIEWQYDDPHLAITIVVCLLGVLFSVWEECGSFVIVVASMIGFAVRGIIATLSTRFLLSEYRFISREECATELA